MHRYSRYQVHFSGRGGGFWQFQNTRPRSGRSFHYTRLHISVNISPTLSSHSQPQAEKQQFPAYPFQKEPLPCTGKRFFGTRDCSLFFEGKPHHPGGVFRLKCNNRLTAAVIRINIIGKNTRFELTRAAHGSARYAQIFRHNKFHTLGQYIPTGRGTVGGMVTAFMPR